MSVTISDLIAMVNVALGDASLVSCPAGDFNQDGAITVEEIVQAVNIALEEPSGGCAG